MALSDKDIIITPNRGASDDPKIEFRGANASVSAQTITARVYPTSGGTLSFEGSAGQLFSVSNSLTGTIFSVNDVSGIPSLEIQDNGLVKLAQYGGNVLIGTATDSGGRLRVAGPAFISQLSVSGFSTSYDFYNNGTSYFNGSVIIDDNLTISAGFNIDAPRFRDSNDTSYYVDPADISRMVRIAFGTNANQVNVNYDQVWRPDAGILYLQASSSGNLSLVAGGGSAGIGTSSPSFPLHVSRNANQVAGFESPNPNTWIDLVSTTRTWSMGSTGSSTWAVYDRGSNATRMEVDTSSNLFAYGSMRSPIFYNYSNTNYYLDPDTKSRLYSLCLYDDRTLTYPGILNLGSIDYNYNFLNGSWSSSITAGILANCADQWEMAIHDAGLRVVSPFLYDGGANHRLLMGRDIGWGTMYIEAANSFRAPIFYDSENVNFYLDPASTTTSLQIAGAIEQGNNFAHPNVEWSASGSSTGLVIFKIPGNTGNYGMVHMVFDIYEYDSPRTATVIIGGHNWNGAWYNTACNVVGYTDKPVRLGVKDGQYCVVFGNYNQTWSYGTIRLRKIHNGSFYDNNMNLGGSYSAFQTTSNTFDAISGDLRELRTPSALYVHGDIVNYGNPIINNTEPTIYLRDTNHRSGMIHVNSNNFYILRGDGTNSTSWAQYASYWPMQLSLSNNDVIFGGNIYRRDAFVPGLFIQDTAPTPYGYGDLWWESDTGKLKIYYNDGGSAQWVDAMPMPDLTTYYSKAGGAISGPVVINSSLTTTGFARIGNINIGMGTYKNTISPIDDNNINILTPTGSLYTNTIIASSGLGIGGVAPDIRLSVSGDAHVSGYFYMGGTAGSVGSWGTRMLGIGGNFTLNTNSFTVNNSGYGTTWSIETDTVGTTKFTKSGYPIVNFNNTANGNYGLIQFSENNTQKTYMGLGGSAQGGLGVNAAYAQDGFSINHDGAGAFTISNRGASKWIRLSTGNEDNANFHTVNIREQKVGIQTNDFSYTSNDNTPVVGSNTNNRLFVDGSIQLLNGNDAIVFGRGAASFFKDEEIGFGWGGGWYMTDGTYLRVRGSKILYNDFIIRSDYDMRAPYFYDQDDTSYFLNPAGPSRVKYIEGSNWASFRGANQAINDWDYGGLAVNPTVSDYSTGAWYVNSTANEWDRGLLSKRRFRRVEGLTFECEIYANNPTIAMFGFVGGENGSYTYCQTPTNLIYLADGSITTYENCGNTGSDYSFDFRSDWWRYKVVLKAAGALYYIHRNGKWNLIKSTSNNDQGSYEYVRVLFSVYVASNNMIIRDAKVYVDTNFYRGNTFQHTISGYGIATTAFQAPRFEDSDNTAYYVNPAGISNVSKLVVNGTSGPSDNVFGPAADIPLHISGTTKANTTILIEGNTNSSIEYPHIILRRLQPPVASRFGSFIRFADKDSSGGEVSSSIYTFNYQTYRYIFVESGGTDDRVILRAGTSSSFHVAQDFIMNLKAVITGVTTPAALDIDCKQSNYFAKTISSDSTFTFSNVPNPGFSVAYSFTLELTHTAGTVTWPASVKWPGNVLPSLTTGKTHLFMFVTDDGGSRWRGSFLSNYDN